MGVRVYHGKIIVGVGLPFEEGGEVKMRLGKRRFYIHCCFLLYYIGREEGCIECLCVFNFKK